MQLTRHFTKPWRDDQQFIVYLARRAAVHDRLDPVLRVDTGLGARLQADLSTLDIDWKHGTRPRLTNDNLYNAYLDGVSSRPALVAHYYAFVLAHLVGGGTSIARSAAPVLPAWFLESSWYYNVESRASLTADILAGIDDEARYWSPEQEKTCLDELEKAFCFGMQILNQ